MFKIACIGLDTSHAVKFTELFQGSAKAVDGFRVIACQRFPSAFQSEADQDKRQKTLEDLGVKVTNSFSEAVRDADGILLEVNDPALHLDYFKQAAETGLPVFLDKPLADTVTNGKKIIEIAEAKKIKFWSSSSLRFTPEIRECCRSVAAPLVCDVYGPLGKAASGSSVVWYGVHAFEMLSVIMGRGAKCIFSRKDEKGVVSIVEYNDGRRGTVQVNECAWQYGGRAQNKDKSQSFLVNFTNAEELYAKLINALADFFLKGTVFVPAEETLEIQAMLNGVEASLSSGKTEKILL
ncbi:MAG: hypothetical protein A2096_05625 [Spirochaetes bacterium GWF1_41_5]|nr:MAG: hypothetical protein A2096_05625 [Spirochaetes bacterium GWF1_41_5]HBE04111.1 hypothetical protein [Spirochaetia bacterium]